MNAFFVVKDDGAPGAAGNHKRGAWPDHVNPSGLNLLQGRVLSANLPHSQRGAGVPALTEALI